jgi:hypothetical protein
LVSNNLDDFGAWQDDSKYGWVWYPRVSETDWRPYWHGNWVWCDPFGWTWVGNEPWGWAPYHYGTWVHRPFGWAWVPGPAFQYWCPAVVSFSEYSGRVGWVALGPGEVVYPDELDIGFTGDDWSLFFSIGGAAVYYPFDNHVCHPRPWRNGLVNRHGFRSTFGANRNVYISKNQFVPSNSKHGGVTSTAVAAFGGRGEYRAEPPVASNFFTHGRAIGAPPTGSAPRGGPIAPPVTSESRIPSRTFLTTKTPDAQVLGRPAFNPPAITGATTNGNSAVRPNSPSSYVGRPAQPSATVYDPQGQQAAQAARNVLSRSPRPQNNQVVVPRNGNQYLGTAGPSVQAPSIPRPSMPAVNTPVSRPYRYPESSAIDSRPWTNRSSQSGSQGASNTSRPSGSSNGGAQKKNDRK